MVVLRARIMCPEAEAPVGTADEVGMEIFNGAVVDWFEEPAVGDVFYR